MLNNQSIEQIRKCNNTGIEYEIALFYALLKDIAPGDGQRVLNAISDRRNTCRDDVKILNICSYTNARAITNELNKRGLILKDVSFETQNDEVGPADIILYTKPKPTVRKKHIGNSNCIGLSVKYENSCRRNPSSRLFLSPEHYEELNRMLTDVAYDYCVEMTLKHGIIENWFRSRKQSLVCNIYYDKFRDYVIDDWNTYFDTPYKQDLLNSLYQSNSPVEFWVVSFYSHGYRLDTKPQTVDLVRAKDIELRPHGKSNIHFVLDGKVVGSLQVKYNNGILESCPITQNPDIIWQGKGVKIGNINSLNYSVKER